MTYVPTAYTRSIASQWWVFISVPSGLVTRLHMHYPTQQDAEKAIAILGFKLIDPPRGELHKIYG